MASTLRPVEMEDPEWIRFDEHGVFLIESAEAIASIAGGAPVEPINLGCPKGGGDNSYCVRVNPGCYEGNLFC